MTSSVLPARQGTAVALVAGERLRIVNRDGGQVVDWWALAHPRDGDDEYASMEHTRAALRRLVPRVGDAIYSTRRRPLVTLVEDTSPGVHDTLIAACDPERYRMLGGAADHPSCAMNFAGAIAEHGRSLPRAPAPLNLFMAIPWSPDGELAFEPSPARAGDSVTFEAAIDVLVVVSACPMDLNPINATMGDIVLQVNL
ncbi:MAG TPA: urea carboxylase-associated family protein [Solirubrobacteraceae bacterium]|nr:urea carboxylase-associated family protein [Solirubrobacteraceae bacterium]